MHNSAVHRKETRSLIVFFLVAYAISWSVGVPLALAHQGLIPPILPPWTHYLIAFGPMISATLMTLIRDGTSGIRDLGRRMILWRNCPKWWIVAFSPLILGYAAILILNRVAGSQITLASLGNVNYLPPLGLGALLLWFLTFGFGEETGWRGFALPRLQRGRSALAATAILATLWALWHLPQFFYLFEPALAPGWAIGLFAGAVLLTWLYNSAKNSVLMVAIWHGCFNFMTASTADIGLPQAVLSTIVMVWAVAVIVRVGPSGLMSL